jgi:outer membrane protein assembly factor BamB
MPRDQQVLVFVGIKDSVLALDERTGAEMWRVELRESGYVSVFWDGESLFAANSGEVWRLDPRSGQLIWHNELKGLGRGLVSLASTRRPTTSADTGFAAEKKRRDAEAAAAAGAASAS